MDTRDTHIAHHRQPRASTPLPDYHHKLVKYCAIMEYEPQVKKPKSPRHAVQDLGTGLPGVDRLDASRGDTAKQDQGAKQSREDNHVGTEQKPPEERTLKRKRAVEEPEVTKSPLVDAGQVEGPSKRMRAVDPITKADRKHWVEYFIRMSRGTEKTQESLLRDIVFEHGNDRNWTYNQWAVYLNNNKANLHHQIDRARRDASKC